MLPKRHPVPEAKAKPISILSILGLAPSGTVLKNHPAYRPERRLLHQRNRMRQGLVSECL